VQLTPRRWLNLQEYQSKKIMADHGVTVQRFFVADSANDALEAAQRLKAKEIVLKAQILAGGRGKGIFNSGLKGGVHLTKDPKTVEQLAKQMIGYNLSTKQTPKDGVTVKKVMVAEALDICRETYFAILMDRACNGPVMVGSPQGGVDIEEVAVTSPELIFKEEIDIFEGVKDRQALQMAKNLGFQGPLQQQAADQIKKLYNLFLKIDATQVEVNPFGETPEGQVVCFDAKINFDDNAEFRQKEIFAMDDKSENEPIENEAAKYDLKYIGLDGNIACFVNGAGLAMATCDIISLNGGKPANFLDLGGGVKEAQVYQAFKLLTADPKVKML
ncbi:SUCB2 ligase, partial [Acrocephalus arundinaceus]|nr:SUCB2 ligase [Acrocephalus arundinaceus]